MDLLIIFYLFREFLLSFRPSFFFFTESSAKFFAFLVSMDVNWLIVKPSSVPGISKSGTILSSIAWRGSPLVAGRPRSTRGSLSSARCGPLVGRGGGFRVLRLLAADAGVDLLRLLF